MAHVLDGESDPPQVLRGSIERLPDIGVHTNVKVAARDSDRRQGRLAVQFGLIVRHRNVERAGVHRIVAGNDTKQARTIACRSSERPDDVEGVRHRHRAPTAHPAICRHEADDARNRGGAADRAARIRAQRRMDHASADGDAGAARRAAGDVLRIPGIATLRIILIVAVRSHGELDHDEAAEIDGAGPVEPVDRRGDVRRPPVCTQLRSAGRHPACPVVHVLVRERHTVQRSERRAAPLALVGRIGGRARAVPVDVDEAIQRVAEPRDAVEAGFRDVTRRRPAGRNRAGGFGKRCSRPISHL